MSSVQICDFVLSEYWSDVQLYRKEMWNESISYDYGKGARECDAWARVT